MRENLSESMEDLAFGDDDWDATLTENKVHITRTGVMEKYDFYEIRIMKSTFELSIFITDYCTAI